MNLPNFKSFKTKRCCFTCAYYSSSRVNIVGFYCTNGIPSYQRADFLCGKYRESSKNDKQLEADYDVLEKRCR